MKTEQVNKLKINTGSLNNVQALRAASALLVVLAHLDGLFASFGFVTKAQASAGIFGTAAAIFFGISGFIMVYTTAGRGMTPWSFMRQRLVRIVPIYWAITIALFVMAAMVPMLLQATRANFGELIYSLAFIPFQKTNGLVEPILFVGWTLNYEMFFYVLFAIGLMSPNHTAGVIAVLVSLASLVAIGQITHPETVLGAFYTNPYILEFGFGMLVALAVNHLPRQASRGAGIGLLAVLVTSTIISVGLPFIAPDTDTVLACGVPGTVLIFCAVALERWGWRINNAILLLLGDASYSIYLTHAFVTQTAEKIGVRLPAGGFFSVALVVAAFIGSCLLGVLIFRTVERPLWYAARRTFIPRRVAPRTA